MGRDSALTPAIQERIVEAVRAGMHIRRAAERAGISETTFYRWMEKGDPDNPAAPPPLQGMKLDRLRSLVKDNQVTLPRRATKEQIVTALTLAGVGSWDQFRTFREAVEAAEADCELRVIAQWQETMRPLTDEKGNVVRPANYNSMATFAARRWPERWSPKHILEISGRDGGPIVTREERADRLAEWLEGILEGAPPEEIGQAVIEVESRVMGE